jgi:hypothetical protein
MMHFGLNNEPTLFSRVVVEAFKIFVHKLLEVYLDDRTMFSLLKYHVETIRLMLDRFRHLQISLNLKKFIFCVSFGIELNHVVCKEGLLVDPVKIDVIVYLPPPNSV